MPESRLADARNRANQMRPMVVQSSEYLYLAKARPRGMYNSGRNQLTSDLLDDWANGNVRQHRAAQYGRALQAMEANKYDEARKTLQPLLAQLTSDLLDDWANGNVRQHRAAQYGRALQAMEANKYDEARKTLQPLLAAEPGNAWYLDLATDIDLGQNKANDAINRLKNARDLRTNPVLQLNLANAYLQGPEKCPRFAHQSGVAAQPGERLSARGATTGSGQYSESLPF